MIQSELFQYEQDIKWEDAGNGVQRQIFGYDDKVMLVKAKFIKGGIGTLHSHPHSQVTYVDSGVFDMTIGDETKTIRKGDGYYVPPHVVHGVICIEAGMLVDAFSPHREDFITPPNLPEGEE
jgi:quercetin dioxygenase-like cupin family protein